MKYSVTKWAVAVAAAIGISGALWAASTDTTGAPHASRTGGGPFPLLNSPIVAALGLTDSQKDQIKGILRDASPTLKPLIESAMQEHRALRTAIQASPVNEAAIRAQSAKLAAVQADLAVQRAQLYQKIKGVLTPAQIDQIERVKDAIEKKVDDKLNRLWGGDDSAAQ